MQVDFYHLTRDPVEKLVPLLASKSLDAGKRVLLLATQSQEDLGNALWTAEPTGFLAHASSDAAGASDQPILISDRCEPANGASYIILADGQWRDDALAFERAFFLFTGEKIDHARSVWRQLKTGELATPRYWKQDGGRWVEGP